MIYLVRIVLHLVLEVSVLVSVSWQDQDQDTNLQDRGHGQDINFQDQDQDQGSKNLPRGSLEAKHCFEASCHWYNVVFIFWLLRC